MNEPGQWSILIPITIFRYMICAVILYWAAKFYEHRHHQALQKRHPFLIQLITFNMVAYVGIMALFLSFRRKLVVELDETIIFVFDFAFHSVFSLHPAASIILAREWMIYFNINYSAQIKKHQWSVHIDGSSASSFWFIEHKKDYGSPGFIKRACIIYYLLIVAFGAFMSFFLTADMNLRWSIDAFIYLIEVVVISLVWLKIPDFYDHFGIKQEMKYVLCGCFCGLVALIFWIAVEITMPSDIVWVCNAIMNIIVSFIVAAIAIIFNSYIFVGRHKHLLTENGQSTFPSIPSTSDAEQHKLRLSDTLNDLQLVDLFMTHLSNEFSVELLLSFIEFSQFKSLMGSDKEFMNEIDVESSLFVKDISLSEQLQLSHIVYEKHKSQTDKYLLIAIDLFEKYVDHSAEFQINISYEIRQQIIAFVKMHKESNSGTRVLDKGDRFQLYTLFDDASKTVYSLMSHSHVRFARLYNK